MTDACGHAVSRRAALSAPVAMALMAGSTTACAQETQPAAGPTSNILVAYFTRSGNTRVIAGQLKRTLGADLSEILPAEPYPEDYQANVDQARRERDAGFEPPLKAEVQNLAAYDTVYLGFPIWGETAPPVIRSFLRRHDLTGKTVRPFITHGGYGLGKPVRPRQPRARRAHPRRLRDGGRPGTSNNHPDYGMAGLRHRRPGQSIGDTHEDANPRQIRP